MILAAMALLFELVLNFLSLVTPNVNRVAAFALAKLTARSW